MHEPAGFWPLGYPGEPVPSVNVADFKSVWAIYQDIESRHGVDSSVIEHACSPGADIDAVRYRCETLQILEMFRGDLLATWKQNGQFQDTVFRVAARIPMNWMVEGLFYSMAFDVDAFFEEVRKEPP